MKEELQQSLCALIRQLGAEAQALRDAGLRVDQKGRQDFVSHADMYVEQQIKAWLKQHCPDDGFLGEESGFEAGAQGIWVLDPIDGTTNYIQGMDFWCISLAYVAHGVITLGIIYAPDRDEFFFARRGEGAYLNQRRLSLIEPEPERVLIGVGRSRRTSPENYAASIVKILNSGMEYRRLSAGALMLAHVAAGQLHAFYEEYNHSWDVLAGILLITEAGGVSNDFLAGEGLLQGNVLLAGCPNVQERLVHLLTGE